MRKPVEMLKLFILYHKTIGLNLITYLHELGAVEIAKIPEHAGITKAGKGNYEKIAMHHIRIGELLRNLGIVYTLPQNPKVRGDSEVIKSAEEFSSIESESKMLLSELSRIASEKEAQAQKLAELEFLLSLGISPQLLASKSVQLSLLLAPQLEGQKADKIPGKDIYRIGSIGNQSLYLGINLATVPAGFSKIDFNGITSSEELLSSIDSCKKTISSLDSALAKAQQRLESIKSKNISKLLVLMYELEAWKQRYEVVVESGQTLSLELVSCWIEKPKLHALEKGLENSFGDSAGVLVAGSSTHLEDAPTLLTNKERMVKPFEFIVNMLSVPQASEIDPSIVLALLIPVMYGMIVGDVGYAIISVILASFLKSKFPNSEMLQNVASIWIFSSVFAVAFGLIFDEWLGLSFKDLMEVIGITVEKNPLQMLGIELSLHRLAALPMLILYCLLLGMVAMVAGFLLGAIGEWHHDKKHSLAKLCWILFVVSLLFIVPNAFFGESFLKLGAWELDVGIGMFAIGVLGITWVEGAAGVFELAGVGGNIMSFIRIAAVGVAGVILAEIINMNFKPSLADPLMFIIVSLLFLGLHTVNAVIAMAEGLIQGGRLGMVEFSTKFFHGGGRLFKPFRLPEKQ